MTTVSPEQRTLEVAMEVATECERAGVPCAVIGAMALAAHKYPRATDDFDLATNSNPFGELQAIAEALRVRGYEVELVTPDADDPLGGVINVTGEGFHLVQVVNYGNPFSSRRTPAAAAIRNAVAGGLPGLEDLRVVTLEDLIALKLYAGGPKSVADIRELLARNAPVDLEKIRSTCESAGLGKAWARLLEPERTAGSNDPSAR